MIIICFIIFNTIIIVLFKRFGYLGTRIKYKIINEFKKYNNIIINNNYLIAFY